MAGFLEYNPMMMTDTPRFRFPPTHRLKSTADFQKVYDRKKSVSDRWIILYAGENGLPHPRLGLSVSRKVGKAHVRNRFKRLYREAFRLTQYRLPPGLDLILIPRRQADEPTLAELMEALPRLAAQAAKKLATTRPSQPLHRTEGAS